MDSLSVEEMLKLIETVDTREKLREILDELCILASNERSNKKMIYLIDQAIEKSIRFNDKITLVDLLGYKIPFLYNQKENINEVRKLISQMKSISEINMYHDRLAWVYSYIWYVEKFEGNKEQSVEAIEKAWELLNKFSYDNEYIYYFVRYSYGFELWVEKHDINSSIIFEECFQYFHKNSFYRSSIQTLGILSIIYTRTQNSNRILELSKRILSDKYHFESLNEEVKAMYYYFTGLGYIIDLNLNFAEYFFDEAYNILQPIHKNSIYFANFIILHSHMITVKALQGKIEQTWDIIKRVEDILKQEFITKNLNSGTIQQISHTLNLNKFYVYSRSIEFDSKEMKGLIEEIFIGSKKLYSNFMLMNEFILNSNLPPSKLKELLLVDSFSINRVKHIISFELLKKKGRKNKEKQKLERIEVLANREKTTKTTFIEDVFADLLITKQLFSSKRFTEIYPLLKKYKNKLHRIEVLELRVFMEAFIQIGEYKSGNPLGPALLYMAIKKCKTYGFSRLENMLHNYLDMLKKDALNSILL